MFSIQFTFVFGGRFAERERDQGQYDEKANILLTLSQIFAVE